MTRIALPAVIIAAVMLCSCTPDRPATRQPAPTAGTLIAEGAVTGLSPNHGNAYTSITPDQYEPLGLRAGDRLHVAFAEFAVTMTIQQTYTDVAVGEPVAVLHREGLTFAIRDGNFSAAYGVGPGDRFVIRAAGLR